VVSRQEQTLLRIHAAVAFLLFAGTLAISLYVGTTSIDRQLQTERTHAQELANSVSDSMALSLMSSQYAARMWSNLVDAWNGEVRDFDAISEQMLDGSSYITSIQVAPDGVVQYVYPADSGELGADLFSMPDRLDELVEARDTRKPVLSGPFDLHQGGSGAIIRWPVYVGDEFWGFSTIIFDINEALDASNSQELLTEEYSWKMWKEMPDGTRTLFEESDEGDLVDPESSSTTFASRTLAVEIAPRGGWTGGESRTLLLLFSLLLASMTTGVYVLIVFYRRRTHDERTMRARAEKDSLTGLYNRLGGEGRIKELMDDGIDGTLFMLDIDDFKTINDTWGHATGDLAIKATADVLADVFRQTDVLVRPMGDEFIVLAVGLNDRGVVDTKARQVLDGVAAIRLDEAPDMRLSVSIGATIFERGTAYQDAFARADALLYESKRRGKATCTTDAGARTADAEGEAEADATDTEGDTEPGVTNAETHAADTESDAEAGAADEETRAADTESGA